MSNNLPVKLPEISFVKEFILQVRLAWRLIRDKRVPLWIKSVPLLAALYLFMPVDVVPDAFLGLGQLDDMAVIALGFRLFTELVPSEIVREHRNILTLESDVTVLEGEAFVVNDESE